MRILLKNISNLYPVADAGEGMKRGAEMENACLLQNAWVLCESGKITGLGVGEPPSEIKLDRIIDCTGRLVLPGFCDSHTHLVFAQSRAGEFTDKIRGLSYEEIARRGGGILNSAAKLRVMSDSELFEASMARAGEILRSGTTTVEIKSGYGLTLKDELRMLRIARRLGNESPLTVRTTLLGAHAIPPEYKERKSEYIDLVTERMIPQAAEEGLADFIDVFCEKGYFTVEESIRIMDAGIRHGLRPKIHVNQFNVLGGVKAAADRGALSVDHLENISEEDISVLANSSTIATLLPGCSFFLGIPYAPARALIQSGVSVSLASDFNPGSSPSGSMPFVMSLACIRMKMLPEEALVASTLNGAAALGLSGQKGSIEKGKDADIIISTQAEQLAELPYFFSRNPVAQVIAKGQWFDFERGE